MKPKHNIGQVVKVYDYYSDMIVRDVYYGLIVDVSSFRFEGGCHFIYHILPNDENIFNKQLSRIQTAEEFAVEAVEM